MTSLQETLERAAERAEESAKGLDLRTKRARDAAADAETLRLIADNLGKLARVQVKSRGIPTTFAPVQQRALDWLVKRSVPR